MSLAVLPFSPSIPIKTDERSLRRLAPLGKLAILSLAGASAILFLHEYDVLYYWILDCPLY